MSKMIEVHALIIDPQNSFCWPGLDMFIEKMQLARLPGTILPFNEWKKEGELYVPGSFEDMMRAASMVKRIGHKFADIHVTLDTHHFLDIAHPSFWISSDGVTNPAPFTLITYDDVEKGVWQARIPIFRKRAKEYVKALETNKRYVLCIWPPHCLIGSFGHNVVQPLYTELLNWEVKYGWVDYVTKGSNMFTEHYSAVIADVPDPEDLSTQLNTKLIEILAKADIIAILGEARSHCLANTIRDISKEFGPEQVKKMVLIEDAMSDVPGFEKLGKDFFDEMTSMGVQTSTTSDFLS